MHKEIFTFSLTNCNLDGDECEKAYLERLSERINNMICESTDIIFFGTSINPDLIAIAECQRNVGEIIKARVGLEPLPEDVGFVIKLHHGNVDITSPTFDKDCVIAITLENDNLHFRHLFKDGDYLQAIKF